MKHRTNLDLTLQQLVNENSFKCTENRINGYLCNSNTHRAKSEREAETEMDGKRVQ